MDNIEGPFEIYRYMSMRYALKRCEDGSTRVFMFTKCDVDVAKFVNKIRPSFGVSALPYRTITSRGKVKVVIEIEQRSNRSIRLHRRASDINVEDLDGDDKSKLLRLLVFRNLAGVKPCNLSSIIVVTEHQYISGDVSFFATDENEVVFDDSNVISDKLSNEMFKGKMLEFASEHLCIPDGEDQLRAYAFKIRCDAIEEFPVQAQRLYSRIIMLIEDARNPNTQHTNYPF